jgi:hypothetical protein
MGSKILGVVVALSIGGSAAWAATTDPPSHKAAAGPGYGYPGAKVTICHRTGSGSSHAITVGQSAVAAHLRHGDTLGPC